MSDKAMQAATERFRLVCAEKDADVRLEVNPFAEGVRAYLSALAEDPEAIEAVAGAMWRAGGTDDERARAVLAALRDRA